MGFINPDLSGALHGDDLKPAIETILREINGSMATDNLADGAVTTTKIEDAAITNAKINDLSADKINAGTIDASVINVVNLDADEIKSGAINASLITTGTLDASQANITNINADNISAGSLTGKVVQTHSSATKGVKLNVADYSGTSGYLEFWDNNVTPDGAIVYYDNSAVLQVEGADLYVNGDVGGDTKSFIIPHPIKKGYKLRYVCPESPEVLAMCRGKGKIKLPDHFISVTVPESIQIVEDYKRGTWLATGVRKGYEDFDPEVKDSNPQTPDDRKKA